ncbi:MAG: ABC transporter permease [Acidimicrobiales bacterium]|nr:ABC transporter permease [Acidimicrobiales bacterium]
MTGFVAVSRLQLRVLRRDPAFLVVMFGMPLAIMPLMKETIALSLVASGFPDANGAEQLVPGQTVLFGFMVAGSAAFALFREHGWRTWDRLRASPASPRQILAGFGAPWVLIHVLFQLVMLGSGALFFDLRLNGGSPVALVLTVVAFAACVVAIVILAAATFRTVNQLQALVNLGALVFGGLGGALVPVEQLPGWAETIAPVSPQYWAMDAFRSVFLERGGVDDVLGPCAILLAIALVASALASIRFRADETKEFFA